jgi:serine/threonine protein kinase
VAVKSVDASRFRSLDEIQQVQEEMAVLSQLKHPNIIRLQEVHFSGNVFFFIMDWASGGSLVQYIYSHEGHALPEKEAHRIFSQLLSGLEYCHKRCTGGRGWGRGAAAGRSRG